MTATTPIDPERLYQNANAVSWKVQAAAEPPDVEFHVVVQASTLLQFRNWMLAGIWQTVFTVVAYVLPTGLLLLGVWLISHRSSAAPELIEARNGMYRGHFCYWTAQRCGCAESRPVLWSRPRLWSGGTGLGSVRTGSVQHHRVGRGVAGFPGWATGSLGDQGLSEGRRHLGDRERRCILARASRICGRFRKFRVWSIIMPALLGAGFAMFLCAGIRELVPPLAEDGAADGGALSFAGVFPAVLSETGKQPMPSCIGHSRRRRSFRWWSPPVPYPGSSSSFSCWFRTKSARLVPTRVRHIARPRSRRAAATLVVLVAVLVQWGWANYAQERSGGARLWEQTRVRT